MEINFQTTSDPYISIWSQIVSYILELLAACLQVQLLTFYVHFTFFQATIANSVLTPHCVICSIILSTLQLGFKINTLIFCRVTY